MHGRNSRGVLKPHPPREFFPFFNSAPRLTHPIDVSSPLQAAAAAFLNREADVRARHFPVATRGMTAVRRFQAAKRRDRKAGRSLIRPENADQVIDLLPVEPEETLHALVCGDFVFCDLLTRIVERLGAPASLTVATLSLSMRNLDALVAMLTAAPAIQFHLILSHYFQSTSKEIFIALEKLLVETFPDRFTLTIGRSHAKVAVFDYGQEGADPLIIETSANLRSSANLEQLAAFRGRELADFHLGWIEEFRAFNAGQESTTQP